MLITDIIKIGDPQIVPFQGKYYMYATSDDHRAVIGRVKIICADGEIQESIE